MKINQLINETTTAGAIATVESPMNGMASRYPKIKGIEPVNKIMKGKRKKKGPYANSMVSENRIQRSPNDLHEEELSEDDLIIVPGQNKRTRGFIPKQDVRTDREVEMAKGDLFQCIKNSKTIFDMIADISEEDGIEGWVQEKIIKASDYLNTVREYMEQQRFANEMTGGVIGNGMAGESISEGKMAELEMDLEDPELSEKHFKQLYGMSRREARETFSQTNTWDFPEVRDPNKKLHEGERRIDPIVTKAVRIMRGGTVDDAEKALITVLGQMEYFNRIGFYNFYIKQILDMYNKKGVAEGLNEMDKSAPQPGRDGKVSHSTYGSRDKKGSDYFKGKEAPGKAVTAKQAEKDALDILKKQGVAEGLKEKEYIVIASMGENDYELEFRAKTPEGALMQAKKWQKQNHIREVHHFTVKEKGVAEGVSRQNLDFDSLYGKVFKIVDNSGNPDNPGFSIVTPLNGESWNWHERPEFKNIVKQRLNDPAFLGDHKYQQIIDAMSGNKFDTFKHQMKEIKQGVAEGKGKATCGCGSECSHCSGNHSLNEVGKKCSCCGNMIKLSMAENKPTMSRAAKGYEKYGKAGMQALAKAGREGKDLDKIRDKYNRYDEDIAEGKKTNPYAIGMAQAMKSTGDKPPLKKSTITKAHDIAKTIKNKG